MTNSGDIGEYLAPDPRSPLYEAQNADRYERQALIREYELAHNARLVVLIDYLFGPSVTLFEETLYGADSGQDLHLLLSTPGGDGETAIRLVRQAQSRCKELTVIVPDQAKSAGTLFVLGAHSVLMSATSDLGPVDPQFRLKDGSFAAGKSIIAAVENAEERIQANPQTYPLYASLLSDVTALMVQQARDGIARSGDQVKEALASNPDRSTEQIENLTGRLHEPLIGSPQSHGAIVSAADAAGLGLPVQHVDPQGPQWQKIWRLWTRYVAIGMPAYDVRVYESRSASQIFGRRGDRLD